MINAIKLQNFGPLDTVTWSGLSNLNLILGKNGTGKTVLLKALYTAIKTVEADKRGNNPKTTAQILWDKLYWTFQSHSIGDLVTKSSGGKLAFEMKVGDNSFSYSFGKDTNKQVNSVLNDVPARSSNSVFLPAKEILSIQAIILKSRERDLEFGFDDTYLDLANALSQTTTSGRNFDVFAKARQSLDTLLGGRITYDARKAEWFYTKGKHVFPISMTAEGIKKISILDTLLGNRYLSPNSIVFIDEPESALHPSAIVDFLDIIATLASSGIQFFMASHSYFVIKKLTLIAREHNLSIPVLIEEEGNWIANNLSNGLPENSIIDESIQLYRAEVDLAFRA